MPKADVVIVEGNDLPYHFFYGQVPEHVLTAIDQELSFYPANYERTTAFQKDEWDGRIQLFQQTRSGKSWYYPAGLKKRVAKVLKIFGIKYAVKRAEKREYLPIEVEWKSDFVLRDYQNEAVAAILEANGGIVSLPTGAGKTIIALKIIQAMDIPVLILVHTKELLVQWKKEIKTHFGIDCGIVGDGMRKWEPITVAMTQTLASMVRKGDIKTLEYGLLVVDECLPYETPVITDAGVLPIGEIVEKRLDVKVMTHTGKFKRILGYQKIPLVKPLVRVMHEWGELICTEDHKIMTPRGWKEARHLDPDFDDVYYLAETNLRPASRSIVRSVKEVTDSRMNFVYDITVDEDHSFIADGVVVSNCHRCPADSTYSVAMRCTARARTGLSATPRRVDNKDLKIFAAVGEVTSNITPCDLVRRGYLAKPMLHLHHVPPDSQFFSYGWPKEYDVGIVANDDRNDMIVEDARHYAANGLQIYIHVERIDHLKILYYRLRKGFEPGQVAYLCGKQPSDDRQEIIRRFKAGEIRVVVGTLLKEGADVPAISCLINASGLKSDVALVQKVGRALRTADGKDSAIIVDFIDSGKFLRKHSEERYQTYMTTYGDCIDITEE